jgi:Fur family zinc uptake transcriptional regulator
MRDGLPRNQALVLAALRAEPGRVLTAYELLARLGPAGVRGPQTVYRALEGLRTSGLIHRVESLNAYTACAHVHAHGDAGEGHDHAPHRPAFAVCRNCGAVRELDDPALAAVLGVVADRSGFAVQDRVIELIGTCPACREAAGRAE